jgi:hypothetical protein|tara:strand:- start:3417 stop:4343 length:927 start_codon:yes stop_codon:yes gene_type:complete
MAISNTPAQDYVQSDYSSGSRFRANGSAQEQKTIENLIVETIEIYGQDIYYVPRTIVNKDSVFGEDSDTKFESAKAIRAYVNNAEGWEGQGELLSKFGVRIEDKTTFIFSRDKFKEHVDDSTVLNVEGRPNEGDLIWFPVTKHLFQIMFVEAEKPFYQLGKGYVWECQCELFEYSDEEIDTGITELDAIETAFANAITVGLVAGGSGTFTAGETVTGGTSNVTAEVKSFDSATRTLIVINRSGTFTIPETITGGTSSASWTTATYNTINNTNSEYDQNNDFETADNDIIDFSETNPFGTVGSVTDGTI